MNTSGSPWEFLPDDELADRSDQGAEESAMHVIGSPSEWPEDGSRTADRVEDEPDSDTDLAVDTLLRRQHYLSGAGGHRAPTSKSDRSDVAAAPMVPRAQARVRLLAERDRLGGLVTLVDHGGAGLSQDELFAEHTGRDQHPADSGTETFEIEAARSLSASFAWELTEVDAALARLEAGTYGRCERCGTLIDPERLDAVPATRLCVVDEAAAEAR